MRNDVHYVSIQKEEFSWKDSLIFIHPEIFRRMNRKKILLFISVDRLSKGECFEIYFK